MCNTVEQHTFYTSCCHIKDTNYQLTGGDIVIATQLSAQRVGQGKYKFIEILFMTWKIAGSRL